MADKEYSRFQQKVIKNYYDNREQIDAQRLAELVTSLYLASEKKAVRMWESAGELMKRLNVPESRIEHIMKQKDAAILASVVEDINNGNIK
ncbi:MAG: hypothetical protein P8M30_11125 [Planctomycetaceae bacterium]|nr:hypothetical protein [Planctomycetaceae bacterium]MDG2389860.1 hypothetical protein [Planctomycetaceae bacterium]